MANFFAGAPAGRAGVRVATAGLHPDCRADLITGPGEGAGAEVTVCLGKDVRPTGPPPASTGVAAFDDLASSPLFTGGVFVG